MDCLSTKHNILIHNMRPATKASGDDIGFPTTIALRYFTLLKMAILDFGDLAIVIVFCISGMRGD